MKPERVAVIGGGAWGTALAAHMARRGASVGLWMRDAELVRRIRSHRDNPAYLPGVEIPPSVEPHVEPGPALAGAEIVLAAVPSQFARAIYRRGAGFLDAATPLVIACKGIEEETLRLPLEVAAEELGDRRPFAVLSGPSFASEVAEGHPTAVVVASERAEVARSLQQAIASRELRLYTNDDPIGVQLAGALKNVIAIAVGIADSLGVGENAIAGLITRGLAELTRLVVGLGGRPETASGLAGLGDLVLTCTGGQSRNRTVGQRLGRGERLTDVLSGARSVAEGVRTARSARALAERARVEMPIVEEVYRILYEDGSPDEGLERLLRRPLTSEVEQGRR